MFISKIFFNNQKIFISLIIFILFISNALCQNNFNRADGEECKVNLHCNSGCCKSGKCSETKECKEIVSTIYKYQAIASAVLVVIFSIYLFLKLRCIKKELNEKTEKK